MFKIFFFLLFLVSYSFSAVEYCDVNLSWYTLDHDSENIVYLGYDKGEMSPRCDLYEETSDKASLHTKSVRQETGADDKTYKYEYENWYVHEECTTEDDIPTASEGWNFVEKIPQSEDNGTVYNEEDDCIQKKEGIENCISYNYYYIKQDCDCKVGYSANTIIDIVKGEGSYSKADGEATCETSCNEDLTCKDTYLKNYSIEEDSEGSSAILSCCVRLKNITYDENGNMHSTSKDVVQNADGSTTTIITDTNLADGSTTTTSITTRNGNIVSRSIVTTNADGSIVSTSTTINADGSTTTTNADGSTTTTNADGSTTTTNADGSTTTTNANYSDSNNSYEERQILGSILSQDRSNGAILSQIDRDIQSNGSELRGIKENIRLGNEQNHNDLEDIKNSIDDLKGDEEQRGNTNTSLENAVNSLIDSFSQSITDIRNLINGYHPQVITFGGGCSDSSISLYGQNVNLMSSFDSNVSIIVPIFNLLMNIIILIVLFKLSVRVISSVIGTYINVISSL